MILALLRRLHAFTSDSPKTVGGEQPSLRSTDRPEAKHFKKRKGAIARPFPSVTKSSSLPCALPFYRVPSAATSLTRPVPRSPCAARPAFPPDRIALSQHRTVPRSARRCCRVVSVPCRSYSIHRCPAQPVRLSPAVPLRTPTPGTLWHHSCNFLPGNRQSHPRNSLDVEISEMWKSRASWEQRLILPWALELPEHSPQSPRAVVARCEACR